MSCICNDFAVPIFRESCYQAAQNLPRMTITLQSRPVQPIGVADKPETGRMIDTAQTHQRRPSQPTKGLSRFASRAAIVTLSVVSFGLAGCASQSTDTSAWLNPKGSQTARLDIDSLDPVTAIAAAQHPLTKQALTHLGIDYTYGGDAPDEGFDCSGLIYYSAQESLGLKLPRRSVDIARVGQKIDRQQLALGDLVFFNTRGSRYSHVGIYLGNELFVHAPSSGGEVRVENMSKRYWASRYNGARRIDPIMLADRLVQR